jgi:hypothetical protein
MHLKFLVFHGQHKINMRADLWSVQSHFALKNISLKRSHYVFNHENNESGLRSACKFPQGRAQPINFKSAVDFISGSRTLAGALLSFSLRSYAIKALRRVTFHAKRDTLARTFNSLLFRAFS